MYHVEEAWLFLVFKLSQRRNRSRNGVRTNPKRKTPTSRRAKLHIHTGGTVRCKKKEIEREIERAREGRREGGERNNTSF